MMERRHTPGPWGDPMKMILVRGATWLGSANWESEEALANESVLRAAPDLLAALTALVLFTKPSRMNAAALNAAYLAIAKAEGRA